MIKIIKYGTREVTKCDSCGCEFSYEEEDIKLFVSAKRAVICPQCKKEIILEATR